MKRLFSLLAALLCLAAAAQDFSVNPERAANERYLYQYLESPLKLPAPKGYKLFYISHYGRHGSRTNVGDSEQKKLLKYLGEGHLTPEGEALLKDVQVMDSLMNGAVGALTTKGIEQHTVIARGMYKRAPSLFGSKGRVRAVSSTVQRCILSMTAFTNELMRLSPKTPLTVDTKDGLMKVLTVKTPKWQKAFLDSLLKTDEPHGCDTMRLKELLFDDPSAYPAKWKSLVSCVYGLAAVAQDIEGAPYMMKYLTPEELRYRWKRSNRFFYLKNCANSISGKSVIPYSGPLANEIVSKADDAIAGNGVTVDLRFGHDFPVLTLLSLMGADVVPPIDSLEELDLKYKGWEVTPMAANIQLYFFRNKKDDVIVWPLLNEHPINIPTLTPVCNGCYRWGEMKELIYNNLNQYSES
ncbi:MAG: hypothetical protein IKR69_02595 [Bacteroidales bacterium]|nr:hypothetical protein [Bacteroidales bacterium]